MRKQMKTIGLVAIMFLNVCFFAHAENGNSAIDRDGDGIPNWEDYCPNTPAGKLVWTSAMIQEKNGNPRWVGCACQGIEQPEASYQPPSRDSVVSRLPRENRIPVTPSGPNGLSVLTKNLAKSYGEMAKATVKPKALIYRKVQEGLQNRVDNLSSVTGTVEVLCGNKLLLQMTLPVIEGTSSKVFEKAILAARELTRLLSGSVGNACELLQINHSAWAIRSILTLMQVGWDALGVVGFKESDLSQVSEIKVSLGVAMAAVENQSFKKALQDFLNAQSKGRHIVESFYENDLVLGVAVMINSLEERLKTFSSSGGEIKKGEELMLGEGVSVSLSQTLVNAARFPIGHSMIAGGSEPDFNPYFAFRMIEPGQFRMGSHSSEPVRYKDETQHEVILTDGFEMQTTEVTQSLWEKVMGSNPSKFKGPNLPVETVSWNDAKEFISRLNQMKKEEGYIYRMPTEAEWEYAARAGTQTAYSFGNDAGQLPQFAWFDGNSGDKTHAVATKEPNSLGLFDMHGNVSEWVEDTYQENLGGAYPVTNPLITSFSHRVIRGGNWFNVAGVLRSAFRDSYSADLRNAFLGFRLVRTPQ